MPSIYVDSLFQMETFLVNFAKEDQNFYRIASRACMVCCFDWRGKNIGRQKEIACAVGQEWTKAFLFVHVGKGRVKGREKASHGLI